MTALIKQVTELTPAGVDTKSDPKTMPPGKLLVGDNVQALRRAGGGVELQKRYGFSSLPRDILGGGTLSSIVQGAEYGNELVVCDGHKLYSYSTILQKWIPKGRNQTIACDIDLISGAESSAEFIGFGTVQGSRPNVDVANFGSYRATVVSFDQNDSNHSNLPCRLYIKETATGAIVGNLNLGGIYRTKLAVLGSSLYVFGSSFGNLFCGRVDLSDPTQLAAFFNAATDQDSTGFDVFDVKADAAHNVVWLAYCTAALNLKIKSVTPSMTIGVTGTYAGIVPSLCINFLEWDFSNSRGYLGIGAVVGGTNTEPHVVEFNTSTAAETNDTTLGGGIGPISQFKIEQFTGYRTAGGKIGAFFYTSDTTDWRQSYTTADYDGNQYNFMFGASPNGRAFKMSGKWYLPMAIGVDEDGCRSILMEVEETAIQASGDVSIAGLIQNQDATGRPLSPGCLSSTPVSGTVAILGVPSVINRAAVTAQINDQRYGASLVALDFSGSGLGAPVIFNGTLHLPSLAHKVYDGKSVVETMFYADGPGLTNLGSDAGGGSMTPGSTVQYCATVSRVDKKGRLSRSTPGPATTITLGGSDTEVVGYVFFYPFTESDPYYNDDPNVSTLNIEIWRTEAGESVFYLDQVIVNDASASTGYTAQFYDQTSDADLIKNELLYTQSGELDNQKAPAVKVLDVWQNRLFALTGETGGAIWNSKKSADGFGAEFSDALRFTVEDRGGRPLDICHIDQTFVILKRESAYLMQGDGPDDKGAGGFSDPARMNADLGIISANARVSIDSGQLVQTAKGMFTLTRGLAWEAAEGVEAYLSGATIKGSTGLDSRSMAIAVVGSQILVRDYLYGIWLRWTSTITSLSSGVGCARWLNNAVVFGSDGVVWAETAGQYFDGSSAAINQRIDFGYVCPHNGRVYQMNFVGDWLATTTLSETTTFDYDPATAETKTRATTAADKSALAVTTSRGRFNAITVSLQETSITQGFCLSRIDVEWGAKQGLKKSPSARFFR